MSNVKKIIGCFFLICAAFLLTNTVIKAQTKDSNRSKWHITTGFGYYSPAPALGENGNIFYSEIGYQLSTGYIIGFGFGMGNIFDRYHENGLFGDIRTYINYDLIRLFIKRPFKFGSNNKNEIKIGIAIVYIQPRYSHPHAYIERSVDDQGNTIGTLKIYQDRTDSKQIDLGFPITFEYGYNFDPLTLGFRGEVFAVSSAGFYGYILSPQISLNF